MYSEAQKRANYKWRAKMQKSIKKYKKSNGKIL